MHKPMVHGFSVSVLLIILIGIAATGSSLAEGCDDAGDYSYVCGPIGAEDLVRIPDTRWILASGFGGDASMYLIDADNKTWEVLYPQEMPRVEQNMALYGACQGAPDPDNFVAHGLNIRAGQNSHSSLYVVGHGAREAIEIFDVDASGEKPLLTWVGCVLTPDGMEANSVASLSDGSMLITIPLHTGISIEQILDEKPTGAIYSWSPGDPGFEKVEGTEMGYANGIAVSADEKTFFVASSAHRKVFAFANTNPTQIEGQTERLTFIPDNLHRDQKGHLITAGLEVDDPVCGDVWAQESFDLAAFASCNRAFTVLSIDPTTLQTSVLAFSTSQDKFSNVTMALEIGDELWIGTFAGDRIAYTSLKQQAD